MDDLEAVSKSTTSIYLAPAMCQVLFYTLGISVNQLSPDPFLMKLHFKWEETDSRWYT